MTLSYLEWAGLLTGVTGVILTIRQVIWSWLFGFINVLIYVYVFYTARLYSDMALQMVYVVFTFYGWYQWKYGGKDQQRMLYVSRWTVYDLLTGVVWMMVFTLLQYMVLHVYTDADFPFWDALLTSGSLWATYLMARKKIECWLIWILVDGGYVLLYYAKDLFLTMTLYAIFTALACKGWLDWKKDYLKEKA